MSQGAVEAEALGAWVAQAFRQACALDVQVRKPGNVSLASPGHGMTAHDFLRSAEAAAPALIAPGATLGERIEAAVAATWAAVGCNTNLGIVLLAAPVAQATLGPQQAARPWWREPPASPARRARLHAALRRVLQSSSVADAQAAFRAIAQARPAGLGQAPQQDVHAPATVTLRDAMALAAGRDRIAQQHAEGYAGLFALPWPAAWPPAPAQVEQLYLRLLGQAPDSHIARKHGAQAAHTVMGEANDWLARTPPPGGWAAEAAWAAWDQALKARGFNPGTCADLTVAALMLAALWHGSAG